MRGTPRRDGKMRHAGRIIPAYAGNTAIALATSLLVRDHPRVCGEHHCREDQVGQGKGSSPRMRGTLALVGEKEGETGIIPAYAGNTSMPSETQPPPRDHPRVCGEHALAFRGQNVSLGSSPRMRGTRFWRTPAPFHFGIIPAYAGNTRVSIKQSDAISDHPRVCGEHSPPMQEIVHTIGIIPAYAGNTSTRPRTCSPTGDHPRVCGEHLVFAMVYVVSVGSSPRMRGTQVFDSQRLIERGIIPAYAGNTQSGTQRDI